MGNRKAILILIAIGAIAILADAADLPDPSDPSDRSDLSGTPAATYPTSRTLALTQPVMLPSGWAPLLARLRSHSADDSADDIANNLADTSLPDPGGLFDWSPSQIVPAIQQRARIIERMTRRRQRAEALGTIADLHVLALHLIDRLAVQSPPPNGDALGAALQIEVLAECLRESCEGENPGRAPYYAREINRAAGRFLAAPRADASATAPAAQTTATTANAPYTADKDSPE